MSERTIEIPQFVEFVRDMLPVSLLDVGCSGSVELYARHVKPLVFEYWGIDLIPSPEEEAFLSYFIQGSVVTDKISKTKFGMVSCISVIEHAGLCTYAAADPRDEQRRIIEKISILAEKYVYLTFPFGQGYCDSFVAIDTPQLANFRNILRDFSLNTEFYRSDAPNTVHQVWLSVDEKEANKIGYDPSMGVQCVCIAKGTVK